MTTDEIVRVLAECRDDAAQRAHKGGDGTSTRAYYERQVAALNAVLPPEMRVRPRPWEKPKPTAPQKAQR